MGMFDTLVAADGATWQTKALDCDLARYAIGDPVATEYRGQFQVEAIHATQEVGGLPMFIDGYATISNGFLAEVGVPRNQDLPLVTAAGRVRPPTS